MARVQLLSDIHFEFHQDGGRSFVSSLDPKGVDILVLAGDTGLSSGGSLQRGLSLLTLKYGDIPIVMVAGNHEFYGTTRQDFWVQIKRLKKDFPTIHVLENDVVTIKGQRFVGCTLWFPDSPSNKMHDHFLPDFRAIKGFRNWNYDVCHESVEYLTKTVQKGDFVITHHIPDSQGIHPKYLRGHSVHYNRYFLCQMPQSVLNRADWWAFGHTHDSMAFEIGGCKFRCNPLAYPAEGNAHFNSRLILNTGIPRT